MEQVFYDNIQVFLSKRRRCVDNVFDKLHPKILKAYFEEFSAELSAQSFLLSNASFNLQKELDKFSLDQADSLKYKRSLWNVVDHFMAVLTHPEGLPQQPPKWLAKVKAGLAGVGFFRMQHLLGNLFLLNHRHLYISKSLQTYITSACIYL